MPSIQRYTVKGKAYWRIVESRRINGKPRAIPILHLGTAETLLKKLQASESTTLSVHSYSHGEVAALKEIADELDIVKIIDLFTGSKTKRGASVGVSLLLIAMNRLLDPGSKREFQSWYDQTSLNKLYPELIKTNLSSQFFWDQMQALPIKAINQIESAITQRVVKKYKLSLDTLFFDTTNCYTYLEDSTPCDIVRYGHSKEKQMNRRLFGVALMVSRSGNIPLCHHAFPGNSHDSTQFPKALTELRNRLGALNLSPTSVTLVFDRGNNSRTNFKSLNVADLGFVAALRVGDVPNDTLRIPSRRFSTIKSGKLEGLRFFRSQVQIDNVSYTSILYLSTRLQKIQMQSLNDQLSKRLEELHEWKATLLNHTDRNGEDATRVRQKIQRILTGQYISEVLSVSYDPKLPAQERLNFSVDEHKKALLAQNFFGRRIIITNRHEWSSEEIIQTYFAQATVEHAFRDLKDDRSIAIRPQFHWTDHSITVHVFTCYLALLLARVLLLKARNAFDPEIQLRPLLHELSLVRLSTIVSVQNNKPSCAWKLESVSESTRKLFEVCCQDKSFV